MIVFSLGAYPDLLIFTTTFVLDFYFGIVILYVPFVPTFVLFHICFPFAYAPTVATFVLLLFHVTVLFVALLRFIVDINFSLFPFNKDINTLFSFTLLVIYST